MHPSIRRLAATIIAAAGLFMVVPQIGQAASASTWVGPAKIVPTRSAPLDWCPGNSPLCQDVNKLALLPANTAVTMVCWIDARNEGYQYPRWFYVTSGTVQGFVKAEQVTNQQPYRPNCLDGAKEHHGIAASLQATGGAEMYQTQPTADDQFKAAKYYKHYLANWGPHLDWSGDCVMWTALAWLRGSTTTLMHSGYAGAADIGRSYNLNPSTNPPRGAAVFWDDGGLGHVALSLGNGVVATTQGTDTYRYLQPTTTKPISAITANMRYMGWVAAP